MLKNEKSAALIGKDGNSHSRIVWCEMLCSREHCSESIKSDNWTRYLYEGCEYADGFIYTAGEVAKIQSFNVNFYVIYSIFDILLNSDTHAKDF